MSKGKRNDATDFNFRPINPLTLHKKINNEQLENPVAVQLNQPFWWKNYIQRVPKALPSALIP